MRAIVCILMGAMLLVAQPGCLAVSAHDIEASFQHEAVAAADGHIYVVDVEELTARRVTIVE